GVRFPSGELLLCHVHLETEPKEHLRQIVVEVAGDLHPLVLALLRHAVGQGAHDALAILELLARGLEGHAAEEHLSREDQGKYERRYCEESHLLYDEEFRHDYPNEPQP